MAASDFSEQFSTVPQRDKEGLLSGTSWVHNDTGQATMFDPKTGTGMHDDPVNGPNRRVMVSQMLQRVNHPRLRSDENTLIDTVNTSRVPLQHLAELHRSGLRLRIGNALGSPGMYYTAQRDVGVPASVTMGEGEEGNASILVHELGHARHDMLSRQFSGRGLRNVGYDATNEGIADGYADRYHGEAGQSYSAEHFNERYGATSRAGERYTTNRVAVASSGVVPHLPSGHGLKSSAQPRTHEQLKLF